MAFSESGYCGAKITSWDEAKNGPHHRAFFRKMVETHSGLSREALFIKVLEELAVGANDQPMASIVKYWFINQWNAWVYERTNPARSAKARKAVLEKGVRKVAVKIRNIVLLDLILPTGKVLRHANGKDCAKAGGFFAKIAAKIKPDRKSVV